MFRQIFDQLSRRRSGESSQGEVMKEIILHAGFPKTATTSLQKTLHGRRKDLLLHAGVLYPSIAENHTTSICTMFLGNPLGHIANKMASVPESDVENVRKKYRKTYEQEFARNNYSRALISAEGVVNMSQPELADLYGWMTRFCKKVTVIMYLREPVDYTTSVMQQILKQGTTLKIMYEKPPVPHYRARIKKFINVFGQENIKFLVYEEEIRKNFGVMNGFLDILGIEDDDFKDSILASQVKTNESLSQLAAHVLDHLNETVPFFIKPGVVNKKRSLWKELDILIGVGGPKFTPPHDVRQRIYKLTRPDVDWIKTNLNLDPYEGYPDLNEEGHLEMSQYPADTVSSISKIILNLVRTSSRQDKLKVRLDSILLKNSCMNYPH